MTIANFILKEQSALVFSDTAMCDLNGNPIGRTTKINVLPHIGAAWVTRGTVAIDNDIYEHMNTFAYTFDAALERLPGKLAESCSIHRANVTVRGFGLVADEVIRGDCWFAGYSGGRYRLFNFCSDDDFEPHEHGPGVYLNPSVAVDMPKSLTLEQAIRVADTQREMMRADASEKGSDWGLGIGGELHAVELSPDGIRMKTVHRWREDAKAIINARVKV